MRSSLLPVSVVRGLAANFGRCPDEPLQSWEPRDHGVDVSSLPHPSFHPAGIRRPFDDHDDPAVTSSIDKQEPMIHIISTEYTAGLPQSRLTACPLRTPRNHSKEAVWARGYESGHVDILRWSLPPFPSFVVTFHLVVTVSLAVTRP